MTSYSDFLAAKKSRASRTGLEVTTIHPFLHDWQGELVQWAAQIGRAAIWADTGLGKTVMQLEWARHMAEGGVALIVAPLAVCQQTVREARRINLDITYTRDGSNLTPGVWITNYEMIDHFDPATINAVVLDESSILKSSDGKTRTKLIEWAETIPYRLSCTATPAPNDPEELTNQAEFLGHMSRTHMLAAYFVHDDTGWRLKGHARRPMIEWMATWAVAIRKPSDMGGSDDGYDLPGLSIIPELVEAPIEAEGQLFATDLGGVGGRAKIRKQTLPDRVARAASIVNDSHGLGAKLTTWDGSPNTNPIGASAWKKTPNTAPELKSRESAVADPLTPTVSTCAPTTSPTPTSSSAPLNSKRNATSAGESGTPTTPSTASEPKRLSPRSALAADSTLGSSGSTGSPSTSLKPCLSGRADAAQSAAQTLDVDLGTDSVLITATRPGGSADSFVASATSGSASSKTTPPRSEAQPTTSNLEPWIIWCGLNDEQDAIARVLGDRAFSLTGSMSPEAKVDLLYRWLDGERPVMISKPTILGTGLNMQHCARMVFVGLSDSYEQYYQAIRRCYRYGQTRVVNVHIVLSEIESQIATNVARKEREASHITEALVTEMKRARTQKGISA